MMRLKARYVPDKRITRVPATYKEIDLGMGLRELKKEIEYFRMMPIMDKPEPRWKKPAIYWSMGAAGAAVSYGIIGLNVSPYNGAAVVIGLAWAAFVIAANATGKGDTWGSTKRRWKRANGRKRRGKRGRRSVFASIAANRYGKGRKRLKGTTMSRQRTA